MSRMRATVVRRLGACGLLGAAGLLAVAGLFGISGLRAAGAQVFTVGERSATADIKTDFKPTRVELPDQAMDERSRRELVRDLEAEQGFAHRVLPLGVTFTLMANGNLNPGPDAYKKLIYEKGTAAAAGERVAITALDVKQDRIVIDINGGPHAKHRILSHVQVGVGGVGTPMAPQESATGCRINLVFEGGLPAVSAPEVKALLEPIVDFGAKTTEVAYADTLPAPLKSAVDSHEVLVGMNRRMVLASVGQPESKVRETENGERYEEWIYGHQPQTVKFVRFNGDKVTQVKVAAMGKAIETHRNSEVAGLEEPAPPPKASLGDIAHEDGQPAGPPSLRAPGEALPADPTPGTTQHKVQYPVPKAADGSGGDTNTGSSPR